MTVLRRILAFNVLMTLSFVHSALFSGLILCAFALGKPEPITFIFGITHGILWIVMCVACGFGARLGTVPITTALTVIILGAAGPYIGSIDFVREQRRRRRGEPLVATAEG